MATAKATATKKLADAACHYRKGGWPAPDYRARGDLAGCKLPRLPKKNHCAKHEAEYVKAAKLRAAAREAASPKAPAASAAKAKALPTARKSPPAPARVTHPRIAAIVAVEPTVTKAAPNS
jgi:hypothetical protein